MMRSPSRSRPPLGMRAAIATWLGASTIFAKPVNMAPPPAAPLPPTTMAKGKASGRTIVVTVVEVAGAQAYLAPGTLGGVFRGAKISINRHNYTVVQASDLFATILIGDDPPREQDKGQATPTDEKVTRVVELAKPRPVSTWQHLWSDPVPPEVRRLHALFRSEGPCAIAVGICGLPPREAHYSPWMLAVRTWAAWISRHAYTPSRSSP